MILEAGVWHRTRFRLLTVIKGIVRWEQFTKCFINKKMSGHGPQAEAGGAQV